MSNCQELWCSALRCHCSLRAGKLATALIRRGVARPGTGVVFTKVDETFMHIENYFELTVDQAIASARQAADQSSFPQTVFRKLGKNAWWHAHPLCRLHERIEQQVTILPANYFGVCKPPRWLLGSLMR